VVKSKDKNLDIFVWAWITAMVGVLNLYLNLEVSYTWKQTLLVVSKSQGQGVYHAQML